MGSKKKGNTKTPTDRSPKAHVPLPPKDIAPTADVQRHQRGETGQFTEKGAPGRWEK